MSKSTGGRRGGGARPHLWPRKVGPYCLLAPPLEYGNNALKPVNGAVLIVLWFQKRKNSRLRRSNKQ